MLKPMHKAPAKCPDSIFRHDPGPPKGRIERPKRHEPPILISSGSLPKPRRDPGRPFPRKW